jgi:hypothetical protein
MSTERCTGKEVPFGSSYNHSECMNCKRSEPLAYSKHTVWVGPIKFEGTCPFKIINQEGN